MNENLKKSQRTIQILFGIILLFTLGNILYYKVLLGSDEKFDQQLIRLGLTILIMYLVYHGKEWAKMAFSLLLLVGIIISVFGFFSVEGNISAILILLLIAGVYGYTIYYMNADNDFQDFMKYQKEKGNRF